jgi:hypothetical protein
VKLDKPVDVEIPLIATASRWRHQWRHPPHRLPHAAHPLPGESRSRSRRTFRTWISQRHPNERAEASRRRTARARRSRRSSPLSRPRRRRSKTRRPWGRTGCSGARCSAAAGAAPGGSGAQSLAPLRPPVPPFGQRRARRRSSLSYVIRVMARRWVGNPGKNTGQPAQCRFHGRGRLGTIAFPNGVRSSRVCTHAATTHGARR